MWLLIKDIAIWHIFTYSKERVVSNLSVLIWEIKVAVCCEKQGGYTSTHSLPECQRNCWGQLGALHHWWYPVTRGFPGCVGQWEEIEVTDWPILTGCPRLLPQSIKRINTLKPVLLSKCLKSFSFIEI